MERGGFDAGSVRGVIGVDIDDASFRAWDQAKKKIETGVVEMERKVNRTELSPKVDPQNRLRDAQGRFKAVGDQAKETSDKVKRNPIQPEFDPKGKLRNAKGQFVGVQDEGKRTARILKGAMVGVGSYIGIAAVSTLTQELFKAGSSATELDNKFKAVFGASADKATKQLKEIAGATSLGEQESRRAAASFQNLLTGAFGGGDKAKKKAAEISVAMTELAADIASFNDVSNEEAIAALASGLSGETEPLKRFGIIINEDRLKAEAFAMGLIKVSKNAPQVKKALLDVEKASTAYSKAVKENGEDSIKAREAANKLALANEKLNKVMSGDGQKLNADQKAMATQSIVRKTMQGTGALGDARKTVNDPAAQAKKATQNFEDLKAKIGQEIVPAIGQAIGQLNKNWPEIEAGTIKVVNALKELAKWMGDNKELVITLAAAFIGLKVAVGVAGSINTLVTAFKLMAPLMGGIKAALTAVKAGMIATRAAAIGLNVALVANPIGAIIIAIAALAAGFVILYKRSERFRNIIHDTWAALKTGFKLTVQGIKDGIDALVEGFWTMVRGVRNAVNAMRNAFNNIVNTAKSIGKGIYDGVTGALQGMGEFVVNAFKRSINKLIGIANKGIRQLNKVADKVPGAGKIPEIPKLAKGGIISGPGTGTSDSILAWLSNGEAVIPAKQTKAHAHLIEALIDGRLDGAPAFAKGRKPKPKPKPKAKADRNSPTVPGSELFGRKISAWNVRRETAAGTASLVDDNAARLAGLSLYRTRQTQLQGYLNSGRYRTWPQMIQAINDELSAVIGQVNSLRAEAPQPVAIDQTQTGLEGAIRDQEIERAISESEGRTFDSTKLAELLRQKMGILRARYVTSSGETRAAIGDAIESIGGQIVGISGMSLGSSTASAADQIASWVAGRRDVVANYGSNVFGRGGAGGTTVNLTQNYKEQPRDPHVYAKQTAHELGLAIGR